jgi:hypothetical protein
MVRGQSGLVPKRERTVIAIGERRHEMLTMRNAGGVDQRRTWNICHRATCRRLALGGFRADILTSYEADEPIEPEDEISPTPGWVTDPNFGSNLE